MARLSRRHALALLLAAAATPGGTLLARPQAPRRSAPALETIAGERLPPEMLGPVVVETWDDVARREATLPRTSFGKRSRHGAQGEWMVASIRRTSKTRSGEHHVLNRWGDTRMGIGFGRIVDVKGAWLVEYEDHSVTTDAIQVVGFRGGIEVARTARLSGIGAEPTWKAFDLRGVDRIEILAEPKLDGYGYYGLDDLTFVPAPSTVGGASGEIVVTFDDLEYEARLAGSRYAGLEWEIGTGEFQDGIDVVHPPLTVPEREPSQGDDAAPTLGGGATAPTLASSFRGPGLNDGSGTGAVPPDTCGAIGPSHFVVVVNSNISVYDRTSGLRVLNQSLAAFFGASGGDPRVTYDKTSQRFVLLDTNFSNRIQVAVSQSSDPTGAWTKTFFNPAGGVDAGDWPDYPTLGVNKDFIATCAYMVGGNATMSCFAIDKNALISGGGLTVTAFRSLAWEGAIHGATTWDDSAPLYLVSRRSNGLRLRRLNLPASAPTLSELGTASVSVGGSPPNAPQQGGPGLDTLDGRLMNAFYRDGSLWTANCIAVNGRAGCRWYEVDVATVTVPQVGTVDDPSLYYFMPSIAANANGDVVMGFTGSNSAQFAGCYFTGRLAGDPPGQMAVPIQYKNGESSYNDGAGPRWGDYSLTSLDPLDETTLWTVQEYARAGNRWGTYVAELAFDTCNVAGYCFTSPNSVGPGSLIASTGSASIAANDFGLVTIGNPPNQNGIFFMGPGQTLVFFGNGVLCVGGGITRYSLAPSDSFGFANYSVDNSIPPALGKIVAGSTWNWQYWYRDPMGGGAGFNLSDALAATYCP